MHKFFTNARYVFTRDREIFSDPLDMNGLDRADIVQSVIIIAGFAIAALSITFWVTTAAMGVGADTAHCVTEYGMDNPQGIDSRCDTRRNYPNGGYSITSRSRSSDAECIIENDKAYYSRFDKGEWCASETKVRE